MDARTATLSSIDRCQPLLLGTHGGVGALDLAAQAALMRDQLARADPGRLQPTTQTLQAGLLCAVRGLEFARGAHSALELSIHGSGRRAGRLDLLGKCAHRLPLCIQRSLGTLRHRDLLTVGADIAVLAVELAQRIALVAQCGGNTAATTQHAPERAGGAVDGGQDDLQAQIVRGRHLGGLAGQ